jgi:hypothetical protein
LVQRIDYDAFGWLMQEQDFGGDTVVVSEGFLGIVFGI